MESLCKIYYLENRENLLSWFYKIQMKKFKNLIVTIETPTLWVLPNREEEGEGWRFKGRGGRGWFFHDIVLEETFNAIHSIYDKYHF